MPIKAVGFDIDGTLYPAGALYWRMLPRALGSLRLLAAFDRVRKDLRALATTPTYRSAPPVGMEAFHRYQAALTAARLGIGEAEALDAIQRFFYEESFERFRTIRCYPHLREVLDRLRQAGLALGALSDFPCLRKLELLGLAGEFRVALASEETGFVKPHRASFDLLASSLGVRNDELLYVGNSEDYDVAGARAAGMRTALIAGGARTRARSAADFTFRDYRQLARYILERGAGN